MSPKSLLLDKDVSPATGGVTVAPAKKAKYLTLDGNEAVAYVAYRCNEVMAFSHIPPPPNRGEGCDQWPSKGEKNLGETTPSVVKMKREGGAGGAFHGPFKTGSLPSPFTAS